MNYVVSPHDGVNGAHQNLLARIRDVGRCRLSGAEGHNSRAAPGGLPYPAVGGTQANSSRVPPGSRTIK